jgi:hypothetical protein
MQLSQAGCIVHTQRGVLLYIMCMKPALAFFCAKNNLLSCSGILECVEQPFSSPLLRIEQPCSSPPYVQNKQVVLPKV